MKKIEVLEERPLKWPDGLDRTRIKDRVGATRWKKPWKETRDALAEELKRLGATSILITTAEDQRLDPGVSVWFSRTKEDFSWQPHSHVWMGKDGGRTQYLYRKGVKLCFQ